MTIAKRIAFGVKWRKIIHRSEATVMSTQFCLKCGWFCLRVEAGSTPPGHEIGLRPGERPPPLPFINVIKTPDIFDMTLQ